MTWQDGLEDIAALLAAADEARDDHGRWTGTGGESGLTADSTARAKGIPQYSTEFLQARHTALAAKIKSQSQPGGHRFKSRADMVQAVIEKGNVRNELVRRGSPPPASELSAHEQRNLTTLAQNPVQRRGSKG